jgi:anti-sigma factor RsiW
MSCPQTALILRLVAGELPSSEAKPLRAHIADCPSCQSTFSQLRQIWCVLGEWEVVPPQDRQDAILASVSALKPERETRLFQRMRQLGALRIAASFALAAGLGIAAGTAVPITRSHSGQAERVAPSDAEVAERLGIPELGAGPATGLGRGLVMNETSGEKEASS